MSRPIVRSLCTRSTARRSALPTLARISLPGTASASFCGRWSTGRYIFTMMCCMCACCSSVRRGQVPELKRGPEKRRAS
eukprot:2743707-Pyramimonas_sp.AAC.1